MRILFPTLAAMAASVLFLNAGIAADAPPARFVDQALAESMAEQCAARAHSNSWPPFTIAVVDAGGALILLRRQDGASSVTAEAALLKARTATRFGAPTQALVAMSKDAPTRDLLLLLQLTDDPGGVPVIATGRVIGGIGVSGGTAEQDVGCANVAIAGLFSEKK
jgi:uncharacterized protein GlcG (DUF336 family)